MLKFKFANLAMLLVSLWLFNGCSRNVHGGDPDLPLSTSDGTTRVFPFSERSVTEAISNAFEIKGYHGMRLYSSAEAPSDFKSQLSTNGFVLFPLIGPIGTVPLHGTPRVVVPYTACFNIVTKAEGDQRTRVSVTTASATVIDGQETGIHGGWANRERVVPPVQREEQNVLDAISEALKVENTKKN